MSDSAKAPEKTLAEINQEKIIEAQGNSGFITEPLPDPRKDFFEEQEEDSVEDTPSEEEVEESTDESSDEDSQEEEETEEEVEEEEEEPAKDASELEELRKQLETANKRIRDTQASYHRKAQEAAELAKKLNTPRESEFKELSPEDEERLLYENYGEWRKYQDEKYKAFAQRPSQEMQSLASRLQAEDRQKVDQQIKVAEDEYWTSNYKDLDSHRGRVETEARLLLESLVRKANTTGVNEQEQQILMDTYMAAQEMRPPTVLIDAAASGFRDVLKQVREEAIKEAKTSRKRLPEDPTVKPSRKKPPPPKPDGPQTFEEEMAQREKNMALRLGA